MTRVLNPVLKILLECVFLINIGSSMPGDQASYSTNKIEIIS